MTLMKKILGVTGVALASTTFLAACSSSSSSSSSSSGKEEVVFATVGTTAPFSYEEDGELTKKQSGLQSLLDLIQENIKWVVITSAILKNAQQNTFSHILSVQHRQYLSCQMTVI